MINFISKAGGIKDGSKAMKRKKIDDRERPANKIQVGKSSKGYERSYQS